MQERGIETGLIRGSYWSFDTATGIHTHTHTSYRRQPAFRAIYIYTGAVYPSFLLNNSGANSIEKRKAKKKKAL